MKVTLIGHASILIESRGLRILSDPWWKGPCYGAQWWLYPEPDRVSVENGKIDYIYISHGHHDHFHPTTLKQFSRDTSVLISKESDLGDAIRELGFKVVELSGHDKYQLGEAISCRILDVGTGDSMMAVCDESETCLNLNDALHAAPAAIQRRFISLLRNLYPSLDYVFCGYGLASHFPNCYVIPGKDRVRTAQMRQSYFSSAWARIVHDVSPKFAFPFAADVVFLEDDLFWSNEAVHNVERPTDLYRRMYSGNATIVKDIAPGFTIENGNVLSNNMRRPVLSEDLSAVFCESIRQVNTHRPSDDRSVREVIDLLRENVDRSDEYFKAFDGNYRCLICFRSSKIGIEIAKRANDLTLKTVQREFRNKEEYNLIFTTRLQYLKRSLTTRYGHETLSVGSGGIFEYTSSNGLTSNMHQELMNMMRQYDETRTLSRESTPGYLYKLKHIAKKFISRTEEDLYDLQKWTDFDKHTA